MLVEEELGLLFDDGVCCMYTYIYVFSCKKSPGVTIIVMTSVVFLAINCFLKTLATALFLSLRQRACFEVILRLGIVINSL